MDNLNKTLREAAREKDLNPTETRRLVARCKRGERGAFDDLIRRYEKKVYNFAFRLCGNYDEANDVASETFYRVYNGLELPRRFQLHYLALPHHHERLSRRPEAQARPPARIARGDD